MRLLAFCPGEVSVLTRNERLDALDRRWSAFAEAIGMAPISLANHPPTLRSVMDRLRPDAVLMSGGGNVATVSGQSTERDACEDAILDWAMENERPVIGVCRGFQAMLARFGAHLTRVEGHVGTRHGVSGTIERNVNSYHEFAAFDAPPMVHPLARSADGAIEAASFEGTQFLGTMWHPEREWPFDPTDLELFGNHVGSVR